MTVTSDRLKELLSYDPDTGLFIWRVDRGTRRCAGSVAGHVFNESGSLQYRSIGIDGRNYKAHRLAWLMVHGRWPANGIDHIDGNGLNNAIANLREATQSENLRNRGASANNKSGLKGVHWHRRDRKWVAQITIAGTPKCLGYFDDPAKAHAAYRAAAKEHHGEFAKVA